jgi:hypothetical protein
MTAKEQEIFRRGAMIAFVTTHVEMGVMDVFKKTPALKNINGISPQLVVGNYIISLFRKMGEPMPTMEEAMLNVDMMRKTGKQIADITRNRNFAITNFGIPASQQHKKVSEDGKRPDKMDFTDKQKEEWR